MLVLTNSDVRSVLDGHEDDVIDIVRQTYIDHASRRTVLPHSTFLRFPGGGPNRIISLPAFVSGDNPVAGVKWIASFPGNIKRGLDRASAVMVLNSPVTGQPEVILEGSRISAWRTSASAALGAAWLAGGRQFTSAALIGCGVINFGVLRFLRHACPAIENLTVFDLNPVAAQGFADRCASQWPEIAVRTALSLDLALREHELVCFATTASVPHTGLTACRPGTLVLHLSLRDITAEAILASRNVVDDADHVCRAETSVHLAAQSAGSRNFIGPSIGEILRGGRPLPPAPDRVTVFSPFGLGVLDVAVAAYVQRAAAARGIGTSVPGFLQASRDADRAGEATARTTLA